MELKRITNINNPIYENALNLYRISFPYHEQREPHSQTEILGFDAYHFDAAYDNGSFVGEILYWEINNFLYIEHFCILPEMRNKGYGQKILELLQPKPLILEIDPPIDNVSLSRKGFYERCGFVANPYPHIHPPYHSGYKGHELLIMSCPNRISADEYNNFNQYLQNIIMKKAF